MDLVAASFALLIPVALGTAWFRLLVPVDVPSRLAIIFGHGTLAGLIAVTIILRWLDSMGRPLSFTDTSLVAIALTAIALLIHFFRTAKDRSTQTNSSGSNTWSQLTLGGRLLFCALLVLVLWRVGILAVEVYWRPLFPWDATMHWATKARVWFEHRSMVPFIGEFEWLRLGGDGFYTDRHPSYPPTIPLLQVWINIALDHWDESLMNLPWLAAFCALGLCFFSQLRVAGLTLPVAMASTYLLLSMPLLNIHVALAGYADLFLGATFACALMALHNWSVKRDRWQAGILIIFTAACYLIKNEGAVWPMTLIPAVAAAFMARREAAKLFFLFCLLGLFGWLVVPKDWALAGIPLNQLAPIFNLNALKGVLTSVFVHNNWHFFGYLMLSLVSLGVLIPGGLTRDFLPLSVALGSAVGLFLFLFLCTGFGWAASNYTAVGRLSIQLAPGLAFLGALLFHEVLERRGFRRPFGTGRS
ncbi:MAG: hypothetical protein AB8C02_13780 [Halioglobus sp.]